MAQTQRHRSVVNQPPHRLGLIRPRLLGRLDRSRAGGLALVVAPAGFGKTTLLAQYAHRHAGPVAWLSVDAADAAEGRVDGLVAEAIGGSAGKADARTALRAAPSGLLLVVDNADHLTGTPDERLLEELLSAAPDGVHVLVAGRRLTAPNLLRHEIAGFFDVLDADQLRFRTWEVERLLADVYGEPLPPDDVALLTRRTGGWAAGLTMFHLATRGRPLPTRQRAVAALSERWDLTRGYLARTVLAELSPEVRRFLVLTSVFDAVTPARCDRLLERTGSARVLDEIIDRYSLPVTSDAGTYRYHQVLRSHLLAALVDDLGQAAAHAWHASAAQLLVAEGALAEAARAYARAGDWRAVADLVTTLGAAVDEVGEDADEPLADLVPDWLLAEDPWLVYAQARRHLTDGRLDAALDALGKAEALFGDDAARVCRHERRIAAIWSPGGQQARLHWAAWLRAATQRHPAVVAGEAMALTGPEGELVRLLADLLAGNIAEALRRATAPVPAAWPEHSVAGLALRLTRGALRLLGPADDAEREALDLVQLADEADAAGVPWLSRIARAMCGLSGDPAHMAEARAVADECERRGDRWGALLATAVTLRNQWRQGRVDHAAAAHLLVWTRELDAGVLQTWAQALVALAAAADGLPEAEMEVRAAANLAASAGVPGAHAAATAAQARLDPADGARQRLTAESARQGAAAGLPAGIVRSWTGAGAPAAAPVPVEITCFGGFRLAVDGRIVDISEVRARARSALRLLAMQAGQMVHREVLIDALWPDLAPAAATRNLQVTISALRGLLERACGPGRPALLVRSDSSYGLALPPGARCDTVTFQAAVARWRRVRAGGDRTAEVAALREALGVYGGDLLPEEGPVDWAVAARDQYRRQATELSRALAATELARGEVAEAVAAAESCLALDPFDDTAWQVLLRGYERAGAPAKAAEARRRYAAMLAKLGLDAAPEPEPAPVGAGARHQPVRVVTNARRSPTPRQPPGGRAPHRRPS